MKTFIPIAILATMAGVQASDFSDIGNIVSDAIDSGLHEHGGSNSGEAHSPAHEEPSSSKSVPQSTPQAAGPSHHSPPIYPHDQSQEDSVPHHGAGHASHPPMAQAERRALRNGGEEADSVDEGNTVGSSDSDSSDSKSDMEEHSPSYHESAPVPTCSTITEHVVKTVTQTVTGMSHHHHSSSPAAHIAMSPESSTSMLIPAPVVSQTPGTPSSTRPVIMNTPMATSSAVAHGTQVVAIPASSSVHGAMVSPSATVHGPASAYSVIPVNVPMASSSHSSIKLHGSNAMATPASSSPGPSGVDPNRAHGTLAATPSPSSFTGAGAQMAPNSGIMAAFGGLMGIVAFVL